MVVKKEDGTVLRDVDVPNDDLGFENVQERLTPEDIRSMLTEYELQTRQKEKQYVRAQPDSDE